MNLRPFLAFLTLCCGIAFAPATGWSKAEAEAACLQTSETNFEFAECTTSIVENADLNLNKAWTRLFQFWGGSRTAEGRALLTEQRAWITFRGKACAEYFLPDHGRESEVLHGPLCIAGVINDRTKDLNNRYELMNP